MAILYGFAVSPEDKATPLFQATLPRMESLSL
jgi:hypothetical protein